MTDNIRYTSTLTGYFLQALCLELTCLWFLGWGGAGKGIGKGNHADNDRGKGIYLKSQFGTLYEWRRVQLLTHRTRWWGPRSPCCYKCQGSPLFGYITLGFIKASNAFMFSTSLKGALDKCNIYLFISSSKEDFKSNQYRNFQLILPMRFHFMRYFVNSIIFRVPHRLLYCVFIEVDFEK